MHTFTRVFAINLLGKMGYWPEQKEPLFKNTFRDIEVVTITALVDSLGGVSQHNRVELLATPQTQTRIWATLQCVVCL